MLIVDDNLRHLSHTQKEQLDSLGTIKVIIRRADVGASTTTDHAPSLRTSSSVSEKAIKGRALSHHVKYVVVALKALQILKVSSFQEPTATKPRDIRRADYVDSRDDPFVTFIFYYRSICE